MKVIKKIILAILIASAALLILPVVMPVNELGYTVEAASVKISKTKYTMSKGETYTLKVTGTKKKVKWSTSNKKVATVNSKGKVTAKAKGTATITAKIGSKKYKCKITVETPSISKTTYSMTKGNTYTLKVNGTNRTVKWSTNNKKVATVNSKGKVTAKAKGTVTITAQVGSKKYRCKITVKDVTTGQKNALKSAESYLKFLHFSEKGLRGQLEYEGYSKNEIDYAIKNCGANWKEEALDSAKSYLDILSFSKKGLIDQLEYEGFSEGEINYAIKYCNADWFKEAAESAKSYLKYSSFSRSALYNQLEYEGFTSEQIEYALKVVGY